MKDFFVSFNGADRPWADWIAWTLEEAGYQLVYQPWDFLPGGNFILEMQKAANDTRKTVIVLSDHYLQATYTQPEWTAAFVEDPQGDQRKLIPLRVAPCKPTGMLRPLIYADLVGLTQDEAKVALLTAVSDRRPKPDQPPGFPGPTRGPGAALGTRGDIRKGSSLGPPPAFPGAASALTRGPGTAPPGRALSLWREKLAFLEEQEPLAVDPAQKFSLRKQVDEAREKIRELGGGNE